MRHSTPTEKISFDPDLKRWTKLTYLQAALGLEVFVAPILVLFYTRHAGYSFSQYGQLLATLFLLGWIFQVPTGAIADRFGRKLSLLLGNSLYCLGMLLLLLLGNAMPFLLFAILSSFGSSMAGGAYQAMMYDAFSQKEMTEQFHHINAKAGSVALLSAAAAGIFGSFVAIYAIWIPMALDCIALAVLTLFMFFMIAPKYDISEARKDKNNSLSLLKTMRGGLKATLSSPQLLYVICLSALVFGCLRASFNFYQPLFDLSKIDLRFFGVIYAGVVAASALTAYLMSKAAKEFINSELPFFIVTLLLLLSTALAWIGKEKLEILLLILILGCHQMARGIYPAYSSYRTNTCLPPSDPNRTTVLSVAALAKAISGAIFAYGSGFLADHYGYLSAFSLIGLATSVGMLLLFFNLWKRKKCAENFSRQA